MNSEATDRKIVLLGGAGLVGQNLVVQLKAMGYRHLLVLDKHRANLALLKQLHPEVEAREADLAEPGDWQQQLAGADVAVMLQAQIGDKEQAPFVRNNVHSTELALKAIAEHRVPYTVHISSSVVNSIARDDYSESKRRQEQLVLESAVPCVVLRPTLMFGWFDRKHLGWLSRFMRRIPVFPVPGHGRYMRQPLYVADFCRVILSCIERPPPEQLYDISGLEQVDYIDIIREVKRAIGSRTLILKIPYSLFHGLLKTWALFDSQPPFTTDQLAALVAGDEFDACDWPQIFGVTQTPFREAVEQTFRDPRYSHIAPEF